MVRYMADSVDSKQIPASIAVPGIAGSQPISLRCGYAASSKYHASSFASGTPDVVVDVSGDYPGSDVLDIERGDATPAQAPAWVKAHNALGGYPAVLYCNRSTLTAVANACAAAGLLPGRDFRWWIATLDGTQRVADMTGVTAVQVWGAQFFPGHNIDLSIVYDDAWKAPAPAPAPPAPVPAPTFDVAAWRINAGQSSPHIQALQEWGNRVYPAYCKIAPTDPHYGPQTVAFVREFAHRSGIPSADGQNIGPQIAAALARAGFRG